MTEINARGWYHDGGHPGWVNRLREVVGAAWRVDEGGGPAFDSPTIPGAVCREALWLEVSGGAVDHDQGDRVDGRTRGHDWLWVRGVTLRAKPIGDICDNFPRMRIQIEPSRRELDGRGDSALLDLTPAEATLLAAYLLNWLIVGQWLGVRTLLWHVMDWHWPTEK
jgi:hypothetical protein